MPKDPTGAALFAASLAKEVHAIHQKFLDKAATLKEDISQIKKGDRGERGPEGPKGKDGKTPKRGIDYLTPAEVRQLTDAVAQEAAKYVEKGKDGRDGVDGKNPDPDMFMQAILKRIRQPKDGQDAVLDYDKLAEAVSDILKKDKKLRKEDIAGLTEEIDSYRHQMAMKQAGQHGGGTTVSAGTNITLTPLPDGTTRIDATGGGSGTVDSVVAGAGIDVDATDPANPVVALDAASQASLALADTALQTVAVDGVTITGDGTAGDPLVAVGGGGNVTKVGTPVDNQIGVWTGDGTIEGDPSLTFDTATDTLSTVVLTTSGNATLGDARTDSHVVNGNLMMNTTGTGANNFSVVNDTADAAYRTDFAGGATYIQAVNAAGSARIPLVMTGSQVNFQAQGNNVFFVDTTGARSLLRIIADTRIGIATTAPDKALEVNLGTTDALRLSYNAPSGSAATYMDATLASDGGVTFTGVGSAPDFTFAQDVIVPDEAYGAGWNGDLSVPTKNAVYDKIETIGGGGLTVGTTTITSGTDTRILYDNAGVLGEYTLTGSGTVVAMATAPTFATSITGSYLTASEILITDGSKNIVSAPVATYPSLAELAYVKGVTSSIQTQLNAKGAGTVTSVGFTGGIISVANPTTTPAFTVAGTSGGVPYFSSTSTWASSAALAANALVVGGGAGAAPATITTGTGVVTALGVNVGSAGAFVVNGGALGTPSSGTVTNLTGTASININGTVGATTPTTGVFTTLVAGSTTSLLLGTAGSAVGNIGFRNATSGTITLAPVTGALGTVTLSLPAATDQLVGRATTDTLTNKTIASASLTGTQLLAEGASIGLDPAGSADGAYSGITVTGTAGYTQAFGDLVYLAVADSRWELADADAAATAGPVALAMVVVAGTDGNACTLLLQGIIRADAKFPTMTVGATQYVGETAGAIQGAIPTGADNIIRTVGYALTADELYFNPSTDWQVTVA